MAVEVAKVAPRQESNGLQTLATGLNIYNSLAGGASGKPDGIASTSAEASAAPGVGAKLDSGMSNYGDAMKRRMNALSGGY